MENVVPLYKKYRRFIYPAPAYKVKLDRPIRIKALPVKHHILARLKNWLTKAKKSLGSLGSKIFKPIVRPCDRYIGNKLLYQLTVLSHSLNKPDFEIFVDYWGHVDELSVRVYIGGWRHGKEVDLLKGSLPGTKDKNAIKPREILKTMKRMKSLSRLDYKLKTSLNRGYMK